MRLIDRYAGLTDLQVVDCLTEFLTGILHADDLAVGRLAELARDRTRGEPGETGRRGNDKPRIAQETVEILRRKELDEPGAPVGVLGLHVASCEGLGRLVDPVAAF